MAEKKSFVVFHDWIEATKSLSNEQVGELLRAMADRDLYNADYAGVDPAVKMCCGFIFPLLDSNKVKYEETCAKRASAGRKGGKSKQKQANASKSKQVQANQADNDIENENEIEKENENEKENPPPSSAVVVDSHLHNPPTERDVADAIFDYVVNCKKPTSEQKRDAMFAVIVDSLKDLSPTQAMKEIENMWERAKGGMNYG